MSWVGPVLSQRGGARDGEGLDPALTVGDLDRQQVIFPGRADLGHHNSGVLDGELRPGGIDSDLQSPKLFLHMEPPSGVMVRRLLDHPMPGPRSGFPWWEKRCPPGQKRSRSGIFFPQKPHLRWVSLFFYTDIPYNVDRFLKKEKWAQYDGT